MPSTTRTKTKKTPTPPSREQDYSLTVDTVAKIVRAQQRGTLSVGLYVRRLPTQIVLENTTESDRAWIEKHFPGGEVQRRGYGVKKTKGSRTSFEEHHYRVNLREDFGKHDFYLPRLEVWGIMLPHECRDFRGYAEDGKEPSWHCGAGGCRKRITKTKARDLGLLPEKKK